MIIEMSKDGDCVVLQTKRRPKLSPLQRDVLRSVENRLNASAYMFMDDGMGGSGECWTVKLPAEFEHTEIVSLIRAHGLDVDIK